MYKVGDEVLVKGKITDIGGVSVKYYDVQFKTYAANVSENEIVSGKTYEQGLMEAWELARKLYCEYTDFDRRNILGITQYETVLTCMMPEEVFSEIEAYERKKEIKVGDEVVHDVNGQKTVFYVTYLKEHQIKGLDDGGDTHYFTLPNQYIKKTGKHIDIESLLRQIVE